MDRSWVFNLARISLQLDLKMWKEAVKLVLSMGLKSQKSQDFHKLDTVCFEIEKLSNNSSWDFECVLLTSDT